MLAEILPTACEAGVLNGNVRPGSAVAVVGSAPIGLAAMTTAKLFRPSHIIATSRLVAPDGCGADVTVNILMREAVPAARRPKLALVPQAGYEADRRS